MRRISFLALFVFIHVVSLNAQDSVFKVIIKPDLRVDFPSQPIRVCNEVAIEKYVAYLDGIAFTITSEKFPINYYGRTIIDAETEFYATYLDKLVGDKSVKDLLEKDTMFDGHKSKELFYIEVNDQNEQAVFIKTIMVGGFESAHYILSIKAKDKNKLNNLQSLSFIKSLNLYYLFESNFDVNDKDNINELKRLGFIVEE